MCRKEFNAGLTIGKQKVAFFAGVVAAPFVLIGVGMESGWVFLAGVLAGVAMAAWLWARHYARLAVAKVRVWTRKISPDESGVIDVQVVERPLLAPAPAPVELYSPTGELVTAEAIDVTDAVFEPVPVQVVDEPGDLVIESIRKPRLNGAEAAARDAAKRAERKRRLREKQPLAAAGNSRIELS